MTYRRLFVFIAVVGVVFGGMAGIASAHDTEEVEGYEITFGGADEPVITGERMWMEVQVVEQTQEGDGGQGDDGDVGTAVEDLEDNLTIAVRAPFGDETHDLDASSRFGEPGWYEAPVLFTEPGTYTVFINATVEGTEINVSFQKEVRNRSTLEFPGESTDEPSSSSLSNGISGVLIGAVIAVTGMIVAFVAGRQRQP